MTVPEGDSKDRYSNVIIFPLDSTFASAGAPRFSSSDGYASLAFQTDALRVEFELKKKRSPDNPISVSSLRRNAILGALGDAASARIIEHGSLVVLSSRQKIYEAEQEFHEVYFPVDCVLSVVTRMADGSEIEVGTIGREGISAFPLLMGASSTANECCCRVHGSAIRVPAALFREMAAADPVFRQVLDRYLQAYVNMLGQLAACNRLHSIYERCARWLLMTRDRVDLDAIPLTQDFLAMMLGTNRSGVAIAAATLQHAGFIRYSHGTIHILDRPGLEMAACECYAVAHKQFSGLLRAVPGADAPAIKAHRTKRARFVRAPDSREL